MDYVFLEKLLLKIKEDTIKFLDKFLKQRQTNELHLTVEQLPNYKSNCTTKIIRLKQKELKNLCEFLMGVQMISCEFRIYPCMKKSSREFSNLEKFKYIKNTIIKIIFSNSSVKRNPNKAKRCFGHLVRVQSHQRHG